MWKTFCKVCKEILPTDHFCYVHSIEPSKKFYDFETQQCERVEGDDKMRIHVPNLCVVRQVCSFCDRNTDISTICTYCGIREYVFDRDPVK